MIVLGIDTALPACSVAILDRGGCGLLASQTAAMPVGHAEALMPMVETALRDAGIALSDVDLFASTVGPGSFTGVRVGLATIRGFALATGRPAVGVTTLECLAETAREAGAVETPFAVAIDARRDEIYLQSFDPAGNPLHEPAISGLDVALDALPREVGAVFGSGAPLLAERAEARGRPLRILGDPAAPSPRSVVARATPDGRPPSPLYLRAPDAKPQAEKVLARR